MYRPCRALVSQLRHCFSSLHRILAEPAAIDLKVVRTYRVFCCVPTLLVVFLVGALQSSAQTTTTQTNYNPNGYDARLILNAIEHPHQDLVVVIGHRGAHALINGEYPQIPENSLQSIRDAASAGWEAVEIDVKNSSDGVPMLSHDYTWGRETCGQWGPGVIRFDPFTAPGWSANDAADVTVVSTSLSATRSFTKTTYLRDSISLQQNLLKNCSIFDGNFYTGEYPPTLADVLDEMTKNKIAMVLTLDIKDRATAGAAWKVLNDHVDYLGRSYSQEVIIKVPGRNFKSTTNYDATFPVGPSGGAHVFPYYNTADIKPSTYGSETAIFQNITDLEADHNVRVSALEIVLKQYNGILTSVLSDVKSFFSTQSSIGNFSPYGERTTPANPNVPEYFTNKGYCAPCDTLATYYYNGAPNNQPSDTDDERGNKDFLIAQGFNVITADDTADYINYLTSMGRHNTSYFRPSGSSTSEDQLTLDGSDYTPEQPGLSYELLAQVNNPSATGTVTFFEDGSAIGTGTLLNGSTSFEVASISSGPHTYTANYSGDATNSPATSNAMNVTPAPATSSTCDIYSSAGTPCVAAHSTVRALFGGYNGRLYQVQRASDGATTDINALTAGGYAAAEAQDSFCEGTTCTITMIYDQSPQHNDLSIEGPGGTVTTADSGAVANALPITVNGKKVYGVKVTPGVGYRRNITSGVATGASPEGMYMVTSGTFVNSGCCFDYGNVETNASDNGNGHMDAVNFTTACVFAPCNGSGPWVEADLENGQYMGNGSNLGDQPISSDFVTAMLKNNGKDTFALKAGNAQAGSLITKYSGSLPTIKSGYIPMSLEGAIVLGTGGDNSNWGQGSFFEGVMTSGYPTDAAEDAVQANIVAAGYTGDSSGGSGSTGVSEPPGPYTGPSDPDGPGPQDGFASPASLQSNAVIATKPALASFNGSLYVAFEGVNASNDLYVTSSSSGNSFPAATRYTNLQSSSAPAMAVFNEQLYMAFRGLNADNDFYVTSSSDGSSFPTATRYTNIQMGGAPALAEFNSQLCAAFQANDPGHTLHVTCSSDGVSWPTAWQVPNVQIGSDPAMAVFNGKLYVAFRADDPSNDVWIASSSDGVNFSSQVLTGQTMGGNSTPALVASNGVLYYIYGANDSDNEMLVTASTDGSTWQGPKAYLDDKMSPLGPGAAAFGTGVSVGFQSNDSRNVLFVTSKVTEAATYTGPSDPDGAGPQDTFASPATEEPNVTMATKPALASFKGNLYVGFEGLNANNDFYLTSSTGANFPAATRYTNIQMSSAPAMAVFNSKLYVAFRGLNANNDFYITSSSDGSTFPAATGHTNIQMGGAPALAVFNKQLCAAFQANDPGHTLHVTCSSDGVTWPDAWQVPNVQVGSDPALAVFNGQLYVGFRADDPSNDVWIASSSDGHAFSSQTLAGQTMGGSSSPALAASTCGLYYIYGANDQANEMLVSASTDGSTWRGPKAYLDNKMGPLGLGASAYNLEIFVGFQSNDSRDVLFTTSGIANYNLVSAGACQY